jgi:DNA-binding Xre family transcriptional regulator
MARVYSAALPVAYVVLRIVIVLNWLYGAAILGLLAFTFVNEPWFMKAIDVPAGTEAEPIMTGLRAVATLGVIAVPLNHLVLTRLVRIIETVSRGDPFVAANAYRLQAIAWALLALQLLSMIIGGIAKAISSPEFPLHLDAGFSILVTLDDVLHDRRMTLSELAERVDITLANLSILKTGKARAVRFSSLNAICDALSCQPGDILRFVADEGQESDEADAS